MLSRAAVALLVPLAGLAGCASYNPRDITGPRIRLEDALGSVGVGMRKLNYELKRTDPGAVGKPLTLGVITCRVTVRFHVDASATKGGNYGADIGTPTNPYVSLTLSGKQESNSLADTGNIVTVELQGTTPEICGQFSSTANSDSSKPKDSGASEGSSKPKGSTARDDKSKQKSTDSRVAGNQAHKPPTRAPVVSTDPNTGRPCVMKGADPMFMAKVDAHGKAQKNANGDWLTELLSQCPQERLQ